MSIEDQISALIAAKGVKKTAKGAHTRSWFHPADPGVIALLEFEMNESQIRAALSAVLAVSNDHDQEAEGGTLQTLREVTVDFLATATPGKLRIPLPLFAIMRESVEVY